MVVQYMVGVCRNIAAAIDATTNWGGRESDDSLLVRTRNISCSIHSQLDMEVFIRGAF